MLTKIIFIAAVAASTSAETTTAAFPQVSADPGTLRLGAVCSSSAQCANGAQCYGTTSMTITTCGSFNAVCQDDTQCTTNTCKDGFCSGFLDPSQYKIPPSSASVSSTVTGSISITSTSMSATMTTSNATPAPTLLPLGANCNSTDQCAGGAQCWASNSMQIKGCGKFNAACESDAQCATNTCNQGICNGFLASESYLMNSASATASGGTASSSTTGTTTIATAGHNGTVSTQSPSAVAAAGAGRLTVWQCGAGLFGIGLGAVWL